MECGIRPALARLNWFRLLSSKLIVLRGAKYDLRPIGLGQGMRPPAHRARACAPVGSWNLGTCRK